MAGDFARADNRIDSTCLDDRAAHTPERIRKAGQGAKGQQKKRGLADKHDEMGLKRTDTDVSEKLCVRY